MFSDEDRDAIQEFFKGTQSLSDNSVIGTFHIKSLPADPIPELSDGKLSIKIIFPRAYPKYESPQSFLTDEQLWIFPHVRKDDGKICPPDSRKWFSDSSLKGYLEYLNELFEKAAANQLEVGDDYYELPQFPVSKLFQLVFVEENPKRWIDTVEPKIGIFSYLVSNLIIRICNFNVDTKQICVGEQIGLYVWFPYEPVLKYKRPPIYFSELFEMLQKRGVSFDNLLREAAKILPKKEFIVIIGFPIKEKNNSIFSDMHWQGLLIDITEYYRIIRKQRKKSKNKKVNFEIANEDFKKTISSKKIDYFSSTNCSKRYLYSRIGDATLVNNCIIFGCGALGSHLANFLAKAGVPKICLCDHELVEPGNVCRHSLNFSSVGKPKTSEMCKMLKDTNPWGEYIFYSVDILELSNESKEIKNLLQYDLWIDAGLPVKASYYLSDFAKANSKRMVSTFITNKAKFLIIAISGQGCHPDVYEILGQMKEYVNKNGDLELKECVSLLEAPEKDVGIRPNTGCYFLTFESSEAKISTASAVIYSNLNNFARVNFEKGRLIVYSYDEAQFVFKQILNLEI